MWVLLEVFFSENGTIENNNFHSLSDSEYYNVLLVGSGNLYRNNTFSCTFYSLFSNAHGMNKTEYVNITGNKFNDVLTVQESTNIFVENNDLYSSALISGNHPAENEPNSPSYNITFDNNNFHGTGLDIENMTNSTIVDNYNMSSITVSQSENISLDSNYVCSGESTITLTSNSHNNTGDNICNTVSDADSNSVTCSCTCSPALNYNSTTASVDIGDDITMETNWTDGYLASENLTCQLYVDGSLSETINSSGSWCNFTYTTTSADYGTKSFYVTAENKIGNSDTSDTMTSTVNLACGSVITSDFTLDQDMNCGGNDGLVIGANGITLDCDSHSITADDCNDGDTGIYINNVNDTTVKNCVISSFGYGVLVNNVAQNNVIDSNTIYSNAYGTVLNGPSPEFNTISNNEMYANTCTGEGTFGRNVYVNLCDNNIVENNILKTSLYGVYLNDADGNNITGNTIKSNRETGMYIDNADNTLVKENTINDNLGESIDAAPPPMCGIYTQCSDNLEILDNTIYNNNPHGIYFNSVDCSNSQTIANNTLRVKAISPEEGYTLNQSNLYENFTYDWSNFLPYALDFTGNCTLYVDGNAKNITSFINEGTDDLGLTNTVSNISINYETQTWYVACEDDNGNTAESEHKTLTTSSSQAQASNIPITTTANTETNINQTELSNNNISANISLMTGVSTTGTITVSQYEDNPAPSTSGFGSQIGLFMSFDLNMSGLDWAIIKMYYSDSDVSGLDENSLRISYYNATSESWQEYDSPYGGVNTSANYVWANTTHFSIFGASGSSSSSDTTPTGGSGGGSKYTYEESLLQNSLTVQGMHRYYVVKFSLDDQSHNIRPDMITSEKVRFKTFSSDPVYTTVYLGETGLLDVDDDGEDDLSITVNSISGDSADVSFRLVEEVQQIEPADIPEPETQPSPEPMPEEDTPEEEKEQIVEIEEQEKTSWTAYIIAAIALLAVLAFIFLKKKDQNFPQP